MTVQRSARRLHNKYHSLHRVLDSLDQTDNNDLSTMEDPVTIVGAKSQPSATSVSPESAIASFSQAAHAAHDNPEVIPSQYTPMY
jgi:hypothetical protein